MPKSNIRVMNDEAGEPDRSRRSGRKTLKKKSFAMGSLRASHQARPGIRKTRSASELETWRKGENHTSSSRKRRLAPGTFRKELGKGGSGSTDANSSKGKRKVVFTLKGREDSLLGCEWWEI